MFNYNQENGDNIASAVGNEAPTMPPPQTEVAHNAPTDSVPATAMDNGEAYAHEAEADNHHYHQMPGDCENDDEEEEEEEEEEDEASEEEDEEAEDDGGVAGPQGDDDDDDVEDEEDGGGVKSSDGQALSGFARTQRSAHVMDSYSPPAVDGSTNGSEVLSYFRHFVQQFNVTPPRDWRQIRFDLPATVAELRLYPPSTEQTQHKRPIVPTTTIVMQLKGLMPADTSVEEYTTQMIQYLFDVLKYVEATTAMTSFRVVKKGAAVTQMVVTFGRDRPLAGRVLEQLRAAGIPAGYALVTHNRDMQPNATFQVRDYKFLLNDGRGMSPEDIMKFFAPFRTSAHDADILVIDGFEPGLFFAPVKRPESIFSFLWNPAVSILMQRFLFETYGVLITQASCPHDFLEKGVPYYVQKQQKELEKQQQLEEKAKKARAAEEKTANAARAKRREDGDDSEPQTADDRASALPLWARQAEQSVDIFGFDAVGHAQSGPGEVGGALKQVLQSTAASRPAVPVHSTPLPVGGHAPYGQALPPSGPPQEAYYYGGGGGGGMMGAAPSMLPAPGPYAPHAYTAATVEGRRRDREEDDEVDTHTADRASSHNTVAEKTGPAVPVRRFQQAKLDPSQDLDEDDGRAGANSGGLFFTDVTATIGSTDIFRHLLEPGSRTSRTATAPTTTTMTDATFVGASGTGAEAISGSGVPLALPQPSQTASPYGEAYAAVDHAPAPTPSFSATGARGTSLFAAPPAAGSYGYYAPEPDHYGSYPPQPQQPQQQQQQQQQQSYYPARAQDGPYSYGETATPHSGYGYGYGTIAPQASARPDVSPAPPSSSSSPPVSAMLPVPAGEVAVASTGGGSILGNAYMQPAGMAPEAADRLVVTMEEHLRNSFPNEFEAYMARVQDVHYLEPDGQESAPLDEDVNRARQDTPVMDQVASEAATLPYRSDELDAFTAHIESEYTRVVQLLQSRYVAALDEPRRRLLNCLLFALPAAEQVHDWEPRQAEDDDDEDDDEGNKVAEFTDALHDAPVTKRKAAYVPALLPYCLASDEGTAVVRALVELYPRHVLPLLARYVLPFLLDSNVVAEIGVPVLFHHPRADNPVCTRLLQHWPCLTAWLTRYVAAQAIKEAQGQVESDAAAANASPATDASDALTAATKAVGKRLASQIGNTLEQILLAMSFSQRIAVRRWSDAQALLDHAFTTSSSPSAHGETTDLATGMWDEKGAVTRTMLRLYLATDSLDGRHLLEVLRTAFGDSVRADVHVNTHALDSESFFYFVRALVAPSRSHVALSRETAAFCGAYVRAVEASVTSSSATEEATRTGFVLGEKELVQIMQSAVRALEAAAAAEAEEAYYSGAPASTSISTAAVAFEALKVAYQNPLSFEPASAASASVHLPAVQRILETARLAAAPVALPLAYPSLGMPGAAPSIMPLPQTAAYAQPMASAQAPYRPEPGVPQAPAPSPLAALEARWPAEWTQKMHHYPRVDAPFTPLPTGWTSSLSRSYGHYYFKPPGAHSSPTYRHPTDAATFMASPQAFLHEPGTSLKLEEVRRKANAMIAETLAAATAAQGMPTPSSTAEAVSAEAAAAWYADQRTRQIGLDLATLELLSIHYRLGGQRRTERESTTMTITTAATSGNAAPVVTRRVEHTAEELAALLARSITTARQYPAKGYPFPNLFNGWTVNMSALNGLYTFQPPRGPDPTIRHPQNRHYYRAAPQAFAEHRSLTAEAIAAATNGARSVDLVKAWLADQRKRDCVLDMTVCQMVKVHYLGIPDIDEPRGGARRN